MYHEELAAKMNQKSHPPNMAVRGTLIRIPIQDWMTFSDWSQLSQNMTDVLITSPRQEIFTSKSMKENPIMHSGSYTAYQKPG